MHIKETPFSFSTVEKVDAIREIKNLKKKKAIQDGDIPVKVLKKMSTFSQNTLAPFTIMQ